MKNKFNKTLFYLIIAVAFFNTSLVFYLENNSDNPLDSLRFEFEGVEEVKAAESNWLLVRDAITQVRALNKSIEDLLAIVAYRDITRSVTFTRTSTINGKTMTIRLTLNTSTTGVSTSLGETNLTFKNKFEIWDSDNSKAMELFFDSATDSSVGNGILLIKRPKVFNSNFTNTATNTILENRITGAVGSRIQTISWINGPLYTNGRHSRVRKKIQEVSGGTVLNIYGTSIYTNNLQCSGANPDFHSLAAIINNSGAYNTTALFGVTGTATIANAQCATTPNPVNYATFNSSGFVSDGLASASIPSGYPTANDVNTLFTTLSADTSLSYTTVNTMTPAFYSLSAP